MSKTDKKQWRGPFGMNAADVVVLLLSSILLFCIAVAMLLGK